MNKNKQLEKYILLINNFVLGEITASQFEVSFLKMFKNEKSQLPKKNYQVLNDLFLDVEAYCNDPTLRDEEDLSEEELLNSAKLALKEII